MVSRGHLRVLLFVMLVSGPFPWSTSALAQDPDATPSGSSAGITLAASGLTQPRDVAWAADGSVYVAQAGLARQTAATPSAVAHLTGGLNGNVAYIEAGCPVPYQDFLPSAQGIGGLDLGPSGLAFVNGQLYVVDEGGGAAHGNPLTPDGIYRIDGGGSAQVIADIGSWIRANPVAEPPDDLDPDGDLTDMVASNSDFLVVESNSGQILRVTLQGDISRVVDLSAGSWRPMGIAMGVDGSMYVGMASATPMEGGSKVIVVNPDGTITDVWTGLTALIDLAIGPDGTLYALEQGDPATDQPLSVAPDTGRVVRQLDEASAQDVAVNLDLPVAMALGPDQGLYVTTPAIAAEAATGAVLRLNLQQGGVMTMSDSVLAASPCIAAPTPAPPSTPVASPDASSESTPADASESADGSAVSIENFSFVSAEITVSAGTTVTWTNNDTVPHTVTSTDNTFNSGNIDPGATFTFTFADAGTFDYVCSYHPNMTGSVVVN